MNKRHEDPTSPARRPRRPQAAQTAKPGRTAVKGRSKRVSPRMLRDLGQSIRRKRRAWSGFHRRQDAEYGWAMAALAGYGAPSLGQLRSAGGAAFRGRPGYNTGHLAASYDAAQTTADNRNHWLAADALGAGAANSPAVRGILRRRARYEVANNCYARGILLTLANDVIGTGPRIQFDTGSSDADSFLEGRFAAWARAVRLAAKLRTARVAKATDGEAFLVLVNNPALRHAVKGDLRLIEADQVTTPDLAMPDAKHCDGITFDSDGNPVEYHILTGHPGEPDGRGQASLYDRVPAASVIHWFRSDRPGQVRGIPEITPALPLFAQLRRYTLAVLDAAESAADFAILLYTEMPPDADEQIGEPGCTRPVKPMTTIEFERRMMTALPAGWKAGQMRAEQPATTYGMFKRELIGEVGRCLNMPYGVAMANCSEYNFASGRLDLLPYRKSLQIEQSDLDADALDRIVNAWLDEALIVYSLEFPVIAALERPRVSWGFVWESVGYGVNPVDEANARRVDLETGCTNLAREHEKAGLDWEAEQERAATTLGLTVQEYRRRLADKLLDVGARGQPVSEEDRLDEVARQERQERQARQDREEQQSRTRRRQEPPNA